MLAHVSSIVAICTTLASAQGLMTGRDILLFSNPGAELAIPNMYISESVFVMQENATNATLYTVVLTHPPGIREDETIDNGEVCIGLTSSPEHFQQDDTNEENGVFEERLTYRTQLIIHTNDNDGDKIKDIATDLALAHFGTNSAATAGSMTEMSDGPASATMLLGPLNICKTYRTVSGNILEQQSPLDATIDPADPIIRVACPVCKCFTIDKATFKPTAKKTIDTFSNVKGPPKEGDINALIDAINSDGIFSRSEVRMSTDVLRNPKLATSVLPVMQTLRLHPDKNSEPQTLKTIPIPLICSRCC
jgi:hypothetical protein